MSNESFSSFSFIKKKCLFKNIFKYRYIFDIPDIKEKILRKRSLNGDRFLFIVKGLFFLINKSDDDIFIVYSLNEPEKDDMVCYAALPYLGVFLDVPVFHVSGVRLGEKYYLFAGKSGSGKSTIAKYLRDNLDANIIADDFIFLTENGLETTAFYIKEDQQYLKNDDFNKEDILDDITYIFIEDFSESKKNKIDEFMFIMKNTYNMNFLKEKGITQKVYTMIAEFYQKNDFIKIDYTKDDHGFERLREIMIEYS
mgnify:CR=1 FL=1